VTRCARRRRPRRGRHRLPGLPPPPRGRAARWRRNDRGHSRRRPARVLCRQRPPLRAPAPPAPGLPRIRRLHPDPPSRVGAGRYRTVREKPAAGPLDWQAVIRLLEPQRAQSRSQKPADVSGLAGWVARLEPGNRNCGLFWAACRIAETGQSDLLGDLAAAAASTGLPGAEIDRTIASAVRTITAVRPH
jgi:hypothetical protein